MKDYKIFIGDEDVIFEVWGASTKHPDANYSMMADVNKGKFVLNPLNMKLADNIFQWLLYIASQQMFTCTSKEIVEYAEMVDTCRDCCYLTECNGEWTCDYDGPRCELGYKECKYYNDGL